MCFFNALLIDDALKSVRKHLCISIHGLKGTLSLLHNRGLGIFCFVKLLKKILDFKKGFINTSSGSFKPKFIRLDADRSRGTFGFNPSKKVFDPHMGFLQGRGDFVPPLPNGVILIFFELISIMMNSGFIIIVNSLPEFKGSRVKLGLVP